MSLNPKVTVVCSCFNHEKYVIEALDSIKNQTYPNIQIIIVDDHSSDNSVQTIENWNKKNLDAIFIKNTSNLGHTISFNNAINYAKGDYLVDLAADDVLLSNCIQEQVNTFESSKMTNLAMVYSNINLVDKNLKFKSVYYDETDNPESGDIYKMVIGRTVKICSVGSMIETKVFLDLGGYDENLIYEDLDLWVRVSRKYNFKYIPKVLVNKRELSNSLGTHFFSKGDLSKKIHKSTLKILEKILLLNTSKDEHKIMLKRIRFEMIKLLNGREPWLFCKIIIIATKAKLRSL